MSKSELGRVRKRWFSKWEIISVDQGMEAEGHLWLRPEWGRATSNKLEVPCGHYLLPQVVGSHGRFANRRVTKSVCVSGSESGSWVEGKGKRPRKLGGPVLQQLRNPCDKAEAAESERQEWF